MNETAASIRAKHGLYLRAVNGIPAKTAVSDETTRSGGVMELAAAIVEIGRALKSAALIEIGKTLQSVPGITRELELIKGELEVAQGALEELEEGTGRAPSSDSKPAAGSFKMQVGERDGGGNLREIKLTSADGQAWRWRVTGRDGNNNIKTMELNPWTT